MICNTDPRTPKTSYHRRPDLPLPLASEAVAAAAVVAAVALGDGVPYEAVGYPKAYAA